MKHFFHIHQNNAFLSAILKRKKKKTTKKPPILFYDNKAKIYAHINTSQGFKKKKKT